MDEINLKLPAKPEYVSVARLTTSAVASRLGFNMDDIEDLKAAVSESGIYLINRFKSLANLIIEYRVHKCEIAIHVSAYDAAALELNKDFSEQNELGMFIIESIMDRVEKDTCNDTVCGFTLYKTCGGQS